MSDYTDAGFDSFLSRSIDSIPQANLDSAGPASMSQAFDRTAVSGVLGDALGIGKINIDGQTGRIGLSNNNNQVLLIGTDSQGQEVVKVAKEGFDAQTARDSDLVFNSAQNTLKIVKSGTESVTSDGSATNWATIPHNLGYAPVPLAFLNNINLTGIATGANIPLPSYSALFVDTVNAQIVMRTWIHALADELNLYLVLFNATGGVIKFNVTYYLLQESAK